MIRKNQGFLTKLYMLTDFAFIQLAFLLAWWVKFESSWFPDEKPLSLETYAIWSLVYGAIALTVGIMISLYSPKRKKRFADEFMKIFQTHFIGMFILLSFMFFVKQVDISRWYLAIYMTLNVVLIILYRFFLKKTLKHYREKGYNRQFVLIVGAGTLGKRFFRNLKQYPELGYEVIGFLDDYQQWSEQEAKRLKPILGSVGDLQKVLDEKMIDEVVLALPLDAHNKYPGIIAACEKAGVRTLIIPDFFDYLPARPMFDILQVCR
ncbi:capsular polysaccharide biosynthesis protein [Paenibacillus sp. JCM 10914]|nr:capsular polysaccharide biosynthesis protein [Paenibacillus sp. JCM 10914]